VNELQRKLKEKDSSIKKINQLLQSAGLSASDAVGGDLQGRVAELEAQVQELQAQLEEEKQKSTARPMDDLLKELQTKLRKKTEGFEKLETEAKNLRDELSQSSKSLAELQDKLKEKDEALAKLTGDLKDRSQRWWY